MYDILYVINTNKVSCFLHIMYQYILVDTDRLIFVRIRHKHNSSIRIVFKRFKTRLLATLRKFESCTTVELGTLRPLKFLKYNKIHQMLLSLRSIVCMIYKKTNSTKQQSNIVHSRITLNKQQT